MRKIKRQPYGWPYGFVNIKEIHKYFEDKATTDERERVCTAINKRDLEGKIMKEVVELLSHLNIRYLRYDQFFNLVNIVESNKKTHNFITLLKSEYPTKSHPKYSGD